MEIGGMLLGLKRLEEMGYDRQIIIDVLSAEVFRSEGAMLAALDAEQQRRGSRSDRNENEPPVKKRQN